MKWNKEKMRKNYKKLPLYLFSSRRICPLCSEKVNPEKEKFETTGASPYQKYFDKFYWIFIIISDCSTDHCDYSCIPPEDTFIFYSFVSVFECIFDYY